MTGFAIGLTQSVPWPSKLIRKGEISRLEADIRALEVNAASDNTIRQIKHGYYQYSYWALADEILERNLSLIRSLIVAAETRYENGLGSARDILRAKTSAARLNVRMAQTSQMRSSALMQLAELTNDMAAAQTDIPADLPEPTSPLLPDLEFERTRNPYLAAAALQVGIAKNELSLAKADYWPDFTLGLEYRIRKDIPIDPVRGSDFISARIGLAIPVWFLSKQRNLSRSARERLSAAEARHQSLATRIERQLLDCRFSLARLIESIELYDEEVLPQVRAALEAAEVAYEVGQVDFDGLLSVQLELLEVELERIDLLRQYHQKVAEASELIGIADER
jgi:outer membrane protein TolC